MIKKLSSTSYRAVALVLIVMIVLILFIAYDIWTGTIHGVRFTYGHNPTWAKDPIFFSFSIGLLVAIAAIGIIACYYMLLDAIRFHRKKASNPESR